MILRKLVTWENFYLLPKIHKRMFNVPGRPAIFNCSTPTEKVSKFLNSHLQPIKRKGLSYVKDSGDFISKIKRIGSVPENAILVTADAVELYPSILHNMGLKAIKQALDKWEQKNIPTEDFFNMTEFVLKSNFFEFHGNIKQQISGTSIGTKCAPTYACIFMDELEWDFFKTQDHQPFLWLRYIDNIFFIWTDGEKKLQNFLEKLNKSHPNIKFTHEPSKENISFLDLNVTLSEGQLQTDLYIKPTDRYQYLHYSSSHPEHTNRSTAFSQSLRVRRTCSYETDYKKNTMEMKSWFLKRAYPKSSVEKELGKVK